MSHQEYLAYLSPGHSNGVCPCHESHKVVSTKKTFSNVVFATTETFLHLWLVTVGLMSQVTEQLLQPHRLQDLHLR